MCASLPRRQKRVLSLIEEVTSDIKDALEEAERIFVSNESILKINFESCFRHSRRIDEACNAGPCESDRIVLFMKPKSWKDKETWKFADEIHKYMKRHL